MLIKQKFIITFDSKLSFDYEFFFYYIFVTYIRRAEPPWKQPVRKLGKVCDLLFTIVEEWGTYLGYIL